MRLLGGFEVWVGDRQVGGFESQKVRALLAYLLCHRRRAFSRDHLAGLLWPERNAEGARHALRQALYNLRSTWPDGLQPPVTSNNLEIGLNPEADCWLDVEAFEEALLWGTEREAVDLHQLSTAAQLYRGELLAGFFVKDSLGFEDWLVTEQTRLREAAVEVLHRLIDSYRRRGEYRFGVHYARRLVAIEPLSEAARRELMRLCALSGQRNRALAVYEELVNALQSELGVEPLEETRALYESILAESVVKEIASRDTEAIGPIVPLAGRAEAYGCLRECWRRVLGNEVHLTLITGEGGVGKTRLIKSFLDVTTSQRQTTVLKGRCHELAPRAGYQPFVEVLRGALAEEDFADQYLDGLPAEVLEDLARLVPELRDLRPELAVQAPLEGVEGRRRLFRSVGLFLEGTCRSGDPLVVFLDDLHLADNDTYDLLSFLLSRLEGPIWIVATYRALELDRDHPLSQIARRLEKSGVATRLEVDRLEPQSVEEIAVSLVGEDQATELAQFLEERSAGLPLAVAELVNFLWDEGVLVARGAGSWNLTSPLAGIDLPAEDVEELIRLRVRRLPNSTRRLASLAAIMGQSFDAQILQDAGEEHVIVVELALEILLKRWLVRQFTHSWQRNQRERDIVHWEKGARRGSFEFSHKRIRSALFHELNPIRRQAMHGQVVVALERLRGERGYEELAYHALAANLWEKALIPLERAAERARCMLARETALYYYDRALEALSRLVGAARSRDQAERWRVERTRFEALRQAAVELRASVTA